MNPRQQPTRLAVLDDHKVLLDGMVEWLQAHAPDFEVVAAVTNWAELVHSAQFPCELVLMDYQLGETISIEARIRTCRAAGANVVVLSGVSQQLTERVINAGALAFLPKTLPMELMMDAVRKAMATVRVSDDSLAWDASAAVAYPDPGLSTSERAALTLYVSGMSTDEVAQRLGVGFETAKTFLRRAREKYRAVGRAAGRRAELVQRAGEDGLLP